MTYFQEDGSVGWGRYLAKLKSSAIRNCSLPDDTVRTKVYEAPERDMAKTPCPQTRIRAEALEQLHQEGVAFRKEIEGGMKGMTEKKIRPPEPTKKDVGKPRLSLLPPSYWKANCHPKAEDMAKWWFLGYALPLSLCFDSLPAFEFGTKKYAPHNWLTGKGLEWSRFVDAYLRHVSVFDEERNVWGPRPDLATLDPETGLAHGCHAEWYLVTLREYVAREFGIDDRPEGS